MRGGGLSEVGEEPNREEKLIGISSPVLVKVRRQVTFIITCHWWRSKKAGTWAGIANQQRGDAVVTTWSPNYHTLVSSPFQSGVTYLTVPLGTTKHHCLLSKRSSGLVTCLYGAHYIPRWQQCSGGWAVFFIAPWHYMSSFLLSNKIAWDCEQFSDAVHAQVEKKIMATVVEDKSGPIFCESWTDAVTTDWTCLWLGRQIRDECK